MEFLVSKIKSHRFINREEDLSPENIMGNSSDLVAFLNPIHVKAKIQMTYTEIVAEGQVKTIGSLNCARCLKNFNKVFKGDFTETYSLDSEVINLTENIRETIILDIPIQSFCKDDCKGICEKCGVNRNKNICKCEKSSEKPLENHMNIFPFK